jgi:hypothetical protein
MIRQVNDMSKYIDITDVRFGRTVARERIGKDNQGCTLWQCECDCGNKHITRLSSLRNGTTKSCSCLQKEVTSRRATTHGLSGNYKHCPRLYRIWKNMKTRCFNPKPYKYKNHGGRGITVCKEWMEYLPFHKWAMSHGYKGNLTIERIDNNGNYKPSNCCWATYKEQALNSRRNHLITYNGETKTLQEWAEILSMKYTTLSSRLTTYGWGIEKAIKTPIIKWRMNRVTKATTTSELSRGGEFYAGR